MLTPTPTPTRWKIVTQLVALLDDPRLVAGVDARLQVAAVGELAGGARVEHERLAVERARVEPASAGVPVCAGQHGDEALLRQRVVTSARGGLGVADDADVHLAAFQPPDRDARSGPRAGACGRPGSAARNACRRSGTPSVIADETKPMSSVPASPRRIRAASSRPSSAPASSRRARSRNASPAAVRATEREVRTSNGPPTICSRRWICCDSGGWAMCSRCRRPAEVQLLGDRHEVAQVPELEIHMRRLSIQTIKMLDVYRPCVDHGAWLTIGSIRTAEDAAAFARLNEEWISDLFTLEDKDRETLADPFGRYVEPGGDVLIARDGEDRVVGCVALEPAGDGVFELSKMTVDPSTAARDRPPADRGGDRPRPRARRDLALPRLQPPACPGRRALRVRRLPPRPARADRRHAVHAGRRVHGARPVRRVSRVR